METIIIFVSLILILVFVFFIFLLIGRGRKIKRGAGETAKRGPAVLSDFKKNWEGVLLHMASINESDWKLAIMEADKIVDRILLERDFKGESMAERMTSIEKKELPSIQLLWEAHKVRNRIAHHPGFKIDFNQAQKVISYYAEVLKDLRAI